MTLLMPLKRTKHLDGYTWSDDGCYYFRLEAGTAIGNTSITNTIYGEELPGAGGIGTKGFYIADALVIFISAELSICKRKSDLEAAFSIDI